MNFCAEGWNAKAAAVAIDIERYTIVYIYDDIWGNGGEARSSSHCSR